MINVAVVGYGYWGPNMVRNFFENREGRVKYICELDEERRNKAKLRYPSALVVDNIDTILNDPEVSAVAIVTPVHTHFELVKRCLESNKHVLVEKPLTDDANNARELVELAKEKNLILMVDHTFVYTGAVRKIKELIYSGNIGELLYFDSIRVNLGLFQHDINVVLDLAPHDIYILDYWLDGKMPDNLSARGICHLNNGLENIAFINIQYPDNFLVHINLNWLSPVKVRQVLIGGTKKMIVYNDIEPTEKVKVYDKGITVNHKGRNDIHNLLIDYRAGDVWSPHLDQREGLNVMISHFLECIKNNKSPITDGECGLRVVTILEAIQKSIKENGRNIVFDHIMKVDPNLFVNDKRRDIPCKI